MAQLWGWGRGRPVPAAWPSVPGQGMERMGWGEPGESWGWARGVWAKQRRRPLGSLCRAGAGWGCALWWSSEDRSNDIRVKTALRGRTAPGVERARPSWGSGTQVSNTGIGIK